MATDLATYEIVTNNRNDSASVQCATCLRNGRFTLWTGAIFTVPAILAEHNNDPAHRRAALALVVNR